MAVGDAYVEDITPSTCCCGSQCSGFGSTVLHHCAPFRSHLALRSAWLAKASSYPNSVPHDGQMMKFFGGSSSRSYPQTGQRYMFRPSLTIRLKILQRRLPAARQLSYDHERGDLAVPRQHPEFTRSRVKAYQISVPSAFQGSLPQWPSHKSVGQPFILIGGRSSKLVPVPHEMPLKVVAMFERHGAGYFPNCTPAGDGLRGGSSAARTSGGFSASAKMILVCPSGLPERCLS
jgi:hypothetical protein